MKQFAKKIALVTTLACSLQGCIFVVGAAAGAAALGLVYDHRSVESTLHDNNLASKISDKIAKVPVLRDSHIEVTVFNEVVLLTGQTPNQEGREKAAEIAKMVMGNDRRIYNEITIQGPTSSLTRTSDSWITTKVRSLMLANEDLKKSSSIKVITENGTVYLMGVVTRQQADIAVDIARQVSGVQRVIKIFQYTN